MAAISRLYISSDDLHAFIDEMLPPRAAARVAAALEQDEAALDRIAAYSRQKAGFKALYGDVIDEAIPAGMLEMLMAARRETAHGQQ